jgi:hypothetical protein
MIVEIKAAAKVGDSLGGIVEVIAYGVPVGLGSHVHWDRKLDGLLAGALMSIQAVKAVEIGDGLIQATQRGSVAHDAIAVDDSFDQGGGYIRRSDHAGGTRGRHLLGAPIIAKVAMKPLATLNRPVLETVDVVTTSRRSRSRSAPTSPRSRPGRRGRGDDGARAGQRGPAQVRRRHGGGVHAQSRLVPRQSRLDGLGRASPELAVAISSSWDCPGRQDDGRAALAARGVRSARHRRPPGVAWAARPAVPARRGRDGVSRARTRGAASALPGPDVVIATGGGIVCSPQARDLLRATSHPLARL